MTAQFVFDAPMSRMTRSNPPLSAKLARLVLLTLPAILTRPVSAKIDFNRDIRPLVSNTCFVCHGPDEATRKAKLRLDVRDTAIARGAIMPGKPAASEAYKRLISKDPDEQMPPPNFPRRLTPEQIETVRRWIV